MDWTYIDNISAIDDNVLSVHCDTRDFHILQTNEDKELHENFKQYENDESHTLSKDEIIPFLKNIETMSGGKGVWRFVNFNGICGQCGIWLKYIRLYKCKNGRFIISDGETVIDKNLITENNLDEKYLNFIKK